MKLQQLALFPLPSHILPGGKLPFACSSRATCRCSRSPSSRIVALAS